MKAKALIIGNANYPGQILDNPLNDASDINDVLIRLGFETLLLLNATAVDQDKGITDFATNIDDYDIALFYFAGHGFQLNNENYLAAIDTNFDDEQHAKHSSFPLNILLSYLNQSKNKTSIIILDACRDSLNKKAWYRSVEDRGLAPIYAPKGTIIAYATSPGEKALDGVGIRNGVYTHSLLQHITVENIPIEEMFKRVRNSVFAFSKGKQTSWEHTSLTGTFYFNSGQLAHSVVIEYIEEVVQDKLYLPNSNTYIDSIISTLKIHNWYRQNPEFERIKTINPNNEDKNKLFLLGRNILQAADGTASAAVEFMENLPKTIQQFNSGNKNHVLNGIIYEIFFNSYGSFRQDNIKYTFLDIVYNVLEDPQHYESKYFLSQILMPYRNSIFYIPLVDDKGISLDVHISTSEHELKVDSIKYEGQEVLIELEKDFWGIEQPVTYKEITFENLKKLIANEIYVPLRKLSLNYNIQIPNNTIIKYPNNHRILK